jgi:hypothetical protein
MKSNFQHPKSVVRYIILGVFCCLFYIPNAKSQTKAELELKAVVYRYNNALHYDSSILVINKFINQKNSSNQNKFYANLYMSYVYKRLQDYVQVNRYLDIAISYGLQTNYKDYFLAIYNCQKSFAYFDVSDFSKADSLMRPLIASNYKYLEFLCNKNAHVNCQFYMQMFYKCMWLLSNLTRWKNVIEKEWPMQIAAAY